MEMTCPHCGKTMTMAMVAQPPGPPAKAHDAVHKALEGMHEGKAHEKAEPKSKESKEPKD